MNSFAKRLLSWQCFSRFSVSLCRCRPQHRTLVEVQGDQLNGKERNRKANTIRITLWTWEPRASLWAPCL